MSTTNGVSAHDAAELERMTKLFESWALAIVGMESSGLHIKQIVVKINELANKELGGHRLVNVVKQVGANGHVYCYSSSFTVIQDALNGVIKRHNDKKHITPSPVNPPNPPPAPNAATAPSAKRKIQFAGYDSDESTGVTFKVGDWVYSESLTKPLFRDKDADASKVKKVALVVKEGDDYFFQLPKGKKMKVVDANMKEVAQHEFTNQNTKPSGNASSEDSYDLDSVPSYSSPEEDGVDFGTYFKPVMTDGDKSLLTKIKARKPLIQKEEEMLQKHMYDARRVDIDSDVPDDIFQHIGNFSASVTRFAGRQPMARMVYEFLYRYMAAHDVIITRDGISEVQKVVKDRCKSLKNKDKFLTKSEGFLVNYK